MKVQVKRSSFTLIEMLVVIAIIGILAGMIFRMMVYANRQAYTAETIQILEKVANALNEFRAEYGQYPPVTETNRYGEQYVPYEHENQMFQSDHQRNIVFPQPESWPEPPPRLFKYGLVSFLIPRHSTNIIHLHEEESVPEVGRCIRDTARDIAAKTRWAPFLEGLIHVDVGPDGASNHCEGIYFNDVHHIYDSWYRDIHYVSEPPYLTYKLWSRGPDKNNGTADDIHRDKWDE